MTSAQIAKLVRTGLDAEDAAALVAAGYETPAQIKDAEDEDLEELIGESETAAVRVVFPARQS